MAQGQEFLFRFLSVRPADPKIKIERAPEKVQLYQGVDHSTNFQTEIAKVANTPDAETAIPGIVDRFRGSPQAVTDLSTLKTPVNAGVDWAIAHAATRLDDS